MLLTTFSQTNISDQRLNSVLDKARNSSTYNLLINNGYDDTYAIVYYLTEQKDIMKNKTKILVSAQENVIIKQSNVITNMQVEKNISDKSHKVDLKIEKVKKVRAGFIGGGVGTAIGMIIGIVLPAVIAKNIEIYR
jgi:hypothetical protein